MKNFGKEEAGKERSGRKSRGKTTEVINYGMVALAFAHGTMSSFCTRLQAVGIQCSQPSKELLKRDCTGTCLPECTPRYDQSTVGARR